MAEALSIHTVYRPTVPATSPVPASTYPVAPLPVATYPTLPTATYPTAPTYLTTTYPTTTYPTPTYPTTPTYPSTSYPTYPTYPTTPTAPATGLGASLSGLVAGAVAGLKSAGIWKTSATYAHHRYRTTSGRAGVGMSGRMGSQFFSAVKSSVLVGSAISIASNVWDVMQNRQTGAQAGANIAGDVMSSAVGGVGGAALSALGTTLLGGVLGTGLMFSVASIGLGVVGFMLADAWLRKTHFFQNTQASVYRMLA